MLELALQALYSGLLTGGYYALIALGLALVFGTMKVINLAHGELVLLAAYIAYFAEAQLKLNPVASIPLALLLVAGAAALIYFLISRIRHDRELNSLILTFGIGIILTNGILMLWSADIRSTSTAWFHESLVLGNTLFSMYAEVTGFIVSLLLVGGLYWWLNHTWQGRAIRAVSMRPDAAMLMGVNPRRIELASFIVAGILATFAGLALYTAKIIEPPLGHALTVKAFIITVLAGMGSIPGVLIGALLIGVIETLTVTFLQPSLQELAGIVLFLIVLLILPSGLAGLFGSLKRTVKL